MTSAEVGTPGNISTPNITEPVPEGGNNEVTTEQTGEVFPFTDIKMCCITKYDPLLYMYSVKAGVSLTLLLHAVYVFTTRHV